MNTGYVELSIQAKAVVLFYVHNVMDHTNFSEGVIQLILNLGARWVWVGIKRHASTDLAQQRVWVLTLVFYVCTV